MIYFEANAGDSDVRGGEPIFDGDNCIGVTTSGAFGHAVGKSLGFGYVDPKYAKEGSVVKLGLLGERIEATVIKDPAYDSKNARLRA